jgi:hypothetical protein
MIKDGAFLKFDVLKKSLVFEAFPKLQFLGKQP